MVNKKNILVIAPHADDEAFGCGGTIAKFSSQGAYIHLVVLSLGIGSHNQERVDACKDSSDILGINKTTILFTGYESMMDTLPQHDLVHALDMILDKDEYDFVFFPCLSHHKDHRITYEASIATLRLGAHKTPKNILMYEYTYPNYDAFGGKYYVDISDVVNRKLDAINAYKSWIHRFPHPASIEASQILSKMRGLAIQVEHAEMFQVVQMIGE